MEEKIFVKVDRNGTQYWNTRIPCDRCGGDGVYKWGAMISCHYGPPVPQHSGTCYKCGGAGYVWELVKEYTPEYRAKLDSAKEKRHAKAEAERAARQAERAARQAEREAEKARREAERQAEIERNRGNYVGTVGDKISVDVVLVRTFTYVTPRYMAPWESDTVTGYVFQTDEGNTFVWKTTGTLRRKTGAQEEPAEGTRLTIKGTIKGHEEYNNVRQTVLNRVAWVA